MAKKSGVGAVVGSSLTVGSLKIRALSPKNAPNRLNKKHFLRPAFYSAVASILMVTLPYPPRAPKALLDVAWVGNSNTVHTFCIRLSALASLHSRNPITQL